MEDATPYGSAVEGVGNSNDVHETHELTKEENEELMKGEGEEQGDDDGDDGDDNDGT